MDSRRPQHRNGLLDAGAICVHTCLVLGYSFFLFLGKNYLEKERARRFWKNLSHAIGARRDRRLHSLHRVLSIIFSQNYFISKGAFEPWSFQGEWDRVGGTKTRCLRAHQAAPDGGGMVGGSRKMFPTGKPLSFLRRNLNNSKNKIKQWFIYLFTRADTKYFKMFLKSKNKLNKKRIL